MDNSVESSRDRAQRQKELGELREKNLAKNQRQKIEDGTMPWSPTVQPPLPMHTHMVNERPTNSPQIHTPPERDLDNRSPSDHETKVESRQDMEEGAVFFEEREDNACRESYNEEFRYPYVYSRNRREDEASTSSTISTVSSLTLIEPMFIKVDEQLRLMKEIAEKEASPTTNFRQEHSSGISLGVVDEEEIEFDTSRTNELFEDEHEICENYFENVSLSSDSDHRETISEVEPKSEQLPVNHHFIYHRHRNVLVRGWNRIAHPIWRYMHDQEEQEMEIPRVLKPKWDKPWSKVDKTAVSDSWRWCLLSIAVVVLISIGVTGVILLTVAGSVSKDTNPSADGSDELTASSRFETLLHMFGPLSGLHFFGDPAFPQYKALEWLANKDPAQLDLSHSSGSVLLQRYIIALLYFTTKGPEWKEQHNFLSEASVCQWNHLIATSNNMYISEQGIICDEQGFVIEVRLGENNLEGVLPWEVASLEYLQVLRLPGNYLTGSLPSQIGALKNLQHINLVSNKLGGAIPTEIGMLQSLCHIDIGSNRIQSVIPTDIGNLINLEVFSADYNMLYGSLPSSVGLLSNLEYLSVAANDLEGQVPSELGALLSLEHLNLRSNGFSGNLDSHFCEKKYESFWTDCWGGTQKVTCSCCTNCCDDTACCGKTECCTLDGESKCDHDLPFQ